jgi:membrane protease subunit HflC
MKLTTWNWLLGGLAALGLVSSAFVVNEGEAAVVHRFGAPRRVLQDAGLYFKWPAPIDSVARVDGRVHLLDPTPSEYLTQDQINVIVDAFVAWRVADPQRFLVRLRTRESADDNLTSILKSSITTVLNRGPISDLLSIEARERTLDKVAEELAAEVQKRVAADDSGIVVDLAGIKRINFPESNKNSVYERMRSEREAEAEETRARGRKEASDVRTRGDLEVAELLAAAKSEALGIRGAATARATELMAEALERYPELVDYLRKAEMFDAAQGDVEIILRSDHPLVRLIERWPEVGQDGKPREPEATKPADSGAQGTTGGQHE